MAAAEEDSALNALRGRLALQQAELRDFMHEAKAAAGTDASGMAAAWASELELMRGSEHVEAAAASAELAAQRKQHEAHEAQLVEVQRDAALAVDEAMAAAQQSVAASAKQVADAQRAREDDQAQARAELAQAVRAVQVAQAKEQLQQASLLELRVALERETAVAERMAAGATELEVEHAQLAADVAGALAAAAEREADIEAAVAVEAGHTEELRQTLAAQKDADAKAAAAETAAEDAAAAADAATKQVAAAAAKELRGFEQSIETLEARMVSACDERSLALQAAASRCKHAPRSQPRSLARQCLQWLHRTTPPRRARVVPGCTAGRAAPRR